MSIYSSEKKLGLKELRRELIFSQSKTSIAAEHKRKYYSL
jgi:hypothetical protein